MATIKISALAGLSGPPVLASNDVLPIVDVSDTTQGPTGTTKKITVLSLFQNVTLNGTPSNYAATVSATTAGGASNGLLVQAASANTDYIARFQTAAGTDKLVLRGDGAIGFNAATPIAKPTVTGSKAANAALTSLCAQLALLGLITDSTT